MTSSTGARAAILGRIRAANATIAVPRPHPGHPPRPVRGQTAPAARVAQFQAEAERADATVARVAGGSDVPGAVAAYLAAHNLGTEIRVAGALKDIPWPQQPMLTADFGPVTDGDAVGVSRARFGVSETGTLVLLSGPASPARLNLLPETHVVVLAADAIETSYEEVWAKIRNAHEGDAPMMPRTVNWITGPSRTADLEQTLLLGAHGPRRLHIIIVDEKTDR